MMWYSNGDTGWGGWSLMATSMVIFWGLIIWGVWSVLHIAPAGERAGSRRQTPEEVLAHRFAAGEIDVDAYRRGLEVLAVGDDLATTRSDR